MIGYFAYSLSGHDKGKIYLIMSEDQDYVYLADGDVRTIDRLKKKNKIFVEKFAPSSKKELFRQIPPPRTQLFAIIYNFNNKLLLPLPAGRHVPV